MSDNVNLKGVIQIYSGVTEVAQWEWGTIYHTKYYLIGERDSGGNVTSGSS